MTQKQSKNFNFNLFQQNVSVALNMYPQWRYGQTLFNVLYDMDPDLANEIRGNSSIDPFYKKDNDCNDFFNWLIKRTQ